MNFNIRDDGDHFLFSLIVENEDSVFRDMLNATLEAEYLSGDWINEKEMANNIISVLFDYGYSVEYSTQELAGESVCVWDL